MAGRRRRRHSDEFKSQVVAASRQPGISMAAVAMAHGINANLLRRWVCQSAVLPQQALTTGARSDQGSDVFVRLALPAPDVSSAPMPEIRIELQRAGTTLKVNWPAGAASECAVWIRELLR